MVASSSVWIQAIPGSGWAPLLSIAALCSSRVSLLPPPPLEFLSFSFHAAPTFQIGTLLSGSSSCSCSQAPREKQNQVEKQPPLAALRATYNADPLSKLLCSPFPLAPLPSLPLSALLLGKSILIFSLFLLPQSRPSSTTNSYLVFLHLLWDRKRQREEGTGREFCSFTGVRTTKKCTCMCLHDGGGSLLFHQNNTHTCLLCYLNVWGVHLHSQSAHLHDCEVGAAVACLALSQWSLLAVVSAMFSNQTWEEWWWVKGCVCVGGAPQGTHFQLWWMCNCSPFLIRSIVCDFFVCFASFSLRKNLLRWKDWRDLGESGI